MFSIFLREPRFPNDPSLTPLGKVGFVPLFLKVDFIKVDELLYMWTCEKLRSLFNKNSFQYGKNRFSL